MEPDVVAKVRAAANKGHACPGDAAVRRDEQAAGLTLNMADATGKQVVGVERVHRQRPPALPGVDTAPDTPAGRTRPEPLRGGRVADYAGHPAADVRRADRRPLVGSGGGLHLDGGARAFARQQTDRRFSEGPRLTGLEPGAADFVGVDAIR